MDNFRWLEENEPPKKHQWLKQYWMHLLAVVIIILLLLYLFLSPNTHTPTREHEPFTHKVEEESISKQITIRLPDKTTKIVNPENNAAETSTLNLSMQQEKQNVATENTSEEKSTVNTLNTPEKSPYTSTRLIQPTTNTPNKDSLNNIGVIGSKNNVTPITNTIPVAEPTIQGTTTIQNNDLSLTPQESTSAENVVNIPEPTEIKPVEIKPVEVKTTEVKPVETTPVVESQVKANENTAVAPITIPSNATEPKPIAPPATTSTATNIVPATNASSNLHWLLQRSPSHYTLQLFASHNEIAIQEFLTKNNLMGKAVYAKMWQNNKDWYVVLMGDYATREQALAAITQLPVSLQSQSPWARSMQSVQDAIKVRLARGD